jgi:hypothetical protein
MEERKKAVGSCRLGDNEGKKMWQQIEEKKWMREN